MRQIPVLTDDLREVNRLLLAVVQAEDAEAATRALTQAGLRVTRISSIGGFLALGNVTLLIGLERGEVARAVTLLATTCRTRAAFINAATLATDWRAGACLLYTSDAADE